MNNRKKSKPRRNLESPTMVALNLIPIIDTPTIHLRTYLASIGEVNLLIFFARQRALK